MRYLLVLLILGLPLMVSPPAHAKGPTDVIVSGPGIEGIAITGTRRPDDVDLLSLTESTSLFGLGDAPRRERPALTRVELGPRYELTWYVLGSVMARTRAYPFAEGGAWAQAPGERRGWVRGGQELRRHFVSLGAVRAEEPPPAAAAATASPAVEAEQPEAAGPESTAAEVPVAGLATGLAAVMLLGAGAWLWRRRAHARLLTKPD